MRRLIALALLAGCGAPDDFVAIERDFEGFRGWERRIPADDDGIDEAIYGNDLALAGPPYPVGTILVSADEIGPAPAWRIHAMVRRGEGYQGLGHWELFELFVDERDVPRIVWRGPRAPIGAGYGDVGSEDCVDCHADPARDHVIGW